MNILVTGGAGYLGSTLVPLLLEAGHRVRILDAMRYGGESLLGVWTHPQFECRTGDIRDPAAVRAALDEIEAVVHLAAIVGDPACARDPQAARSINLDASLHLVASSAEAGVSRFVFASTCSNYGRMNVADGYADEASPLAPVSLYAETKVAVERALLDGSCAGPMCATSLRFATVYGVSPRMRFDLTVNEFTAEMLVAGRLVVFGEQFWRPYVHVRDAARAIRTVLEASEAVVRGAVFNVGATEENYQKQQLVELIRPLAPSAQVEYVHRVEDPRDYRVCFTHIRERLGFEITRTVPEGIGEVARLMTAGAIVDFHAPRYRN